MLVEKQKVTLIFHMVLEVSEKRFDLKSGKSLGKYKIYFTDGGGVNK
ncbi:hypothetical protein P4J60_26745 [Bacillus cereus]|nr:hypothetical protein [Bacillus cereus]MEB9570808.1 hypothetical protein [Bacillus cereus]